MKQNWESRAGVLWALLGLGFVAIPACEFGAGGSGSAACGTVAEIPDGMVKSSMCIRAASGGTINLPSRPDIGGGTLFIPPGALMQDTQITVYSTEFVEPGVSRLTFEPDGLIFQEPARLTLPFALDEDGDVPMLNFYQSSSLNDENDVGNELHTLDGFENVEVDADNGLISGDMHHFSEAFVMFGMQDPAYLVVDLPGGYLRPGDGLFAMSFGKPGGASWYTGHVGMIHSIKDDDYGVPAATVIESTVGAVRGVQKNSLTTFRGQGYYLGARRQTSHALTQDERRAAAEFATSKLHENYAMIAAPLTGGFFGWSCTSLLESAWEAADRGVMNSLSFWASPVQMFANTVPVTDITVEYDDEIAFQVYDVVFSPNAHGWGTDDAFYLSQREAHATMSATGLPPGATFVNDRAMPGGGPPEPGGIEMFQWTPKKIDVGMTYPVTFDMTGVATVNVGGVGGLHSYDLTQTVNMHVRGATGSITVNPVPQGDNYRLYSMFLPVPEGATIVDIGLLDPASGEFPEGEIFPGQRIDDVSYGPSSPGSDQHGVNFTLRNDTPEVTLSPTPAAAQLRVYVQYEQDEYLGPEF